MQYDKKHDIEYQLDRLIDDLVVWYEFIDAETTAETLFDHRNIEFLSAAMFTAKLRQSHFSKTGSPYIASLHARNAVNFEWLLFQECN